MDTEDDFEVRSNDFVDAVERVESAVARVEQAVKDKWSSAVIIVDNSCGFSVGHSGGTCGIPNFDMNWSTAYPLTK